MVPWMLSEEIGLLFLYPFVLLREGGEVSIMVYVLGNYFRVNLIFLDLY